MLFRSLFDDMRDKSQVVPNEQVVCFAVAVLFVAVEVHAFFLGGERLGKRPVVVDERRKKEDTRQERHKCFDYHRPSLSTDLVWASEFYCMPNNVEICLSVLFCVGKVERIGLKHGYFYIKILAIIKIICYNKPKRGRLH